MLKNDENDYEPLLRDNHSDNILYAYKESGNLDIKEELKTVLNDNNNVHGVLTQDKHLQKEIDAIKKMKITELRDKAYELDINAKDENGKNKLKADLMKDLVNSLV